MRGKEREKKLQQAHGSGDPEDQSETEKGREAEAGTQAADVGIKRSQTLALLDSLPRREIFGSMLCDDWKQETKGGFGNHGVG